VQLEAHEILVGGPPWDTTVCIHFTDQAEGPDAETVYRNRGTIFAKVAWGKIRCEISYEDTQRVAAFDEYLAAHDLAPA
jgi:hypothetical protein